LADAIELLLSPELLELAAIAGSGQIRKAIGATMTGLELANLAMETASHIYGGRSLVAMTAAELG